MRSVPSRIDHAVLLFATVSAERQAMVSGAKSVERNQIQADPDTNLLWAACSSL